MTTREDILSLAVPEVTDAMVEAAYREGSWIGPDVLRKIIRAALAAAPTPPAAEAPGQEPVVDGWFGPYAVEFVGPAVWASVVDEMDPRLAGKQVYVTVSAPPTYADAEAKFEQAVKWLDDKVAAIEAQVPLHQPSLLKDHLISQLGAYKKAATAIRSLASPAPKEPGQ